MCTDSNMEDSKDRFKGLTVEQALLRSPADMYDRGRWAIRECENQPYLVRLARRFQKLWELFCQAEAAAAKCTESGCKGAGRLMSFTRRDSGLSPSPEFWCERHGPGDPDFDTPKMPISIREIWRFNTKGDRRRFAKYIRYALGIPKGTRITEEFANRWFADIEDGD